MKNVRYKQGNPTETRTIPARTQKAKPYSELGIIDLHRNTDTYIAPSPRQQICPAAADNPGVRRWSPLNHASVVPWRRGAPQSPSPSSFGAPQGNNKIYKCDVVFPIGEANTIDISKTSIPYKITNDISQTQFPYKITNDSSKTPIPYKKGFHPKGQNPFLILQIFEKLTP